VFAAPESVDARALLARTHRQMAYQAESAIWRNMYLSAAQELEQGIARRGNVTTSLDLVAATSTAQVLDLLAIRVVPERLGERRYAFNLVFPERNERFAVTIANGVLVHEANVILPNTPTITTARAVFLQALATQSMRQAVVRGDIHIAGNRRSLEGLGEIFETPDVNFPIVTP
jgi:alkyl sulfatase BDS1-like metallo-beta-lactamase superfamily hydrolase